MAKAYNKQLVNTEIYQNAIENILLWIQSYRINDTQNQENKKKFALICDSEVDQYNFLKRDYKKLNLGAEWPKMGIRELCVGYIQGTSKKKQYSTSVYLNLSEP